MLSINNFTKLIQTFALRLSNSMSLRIAPPDIESVEAVLGIDPYLCPHKEGLRINVIGHRGLPLEAPENSLEGFDLCHLNNINTVEFDLNLTKDQIGVVFHDHTLERLTGLRLAIKDAYWDDIKNINLSLHHPNRSTYPETHIPTADQTVQRLLSNGQRMFIDLKSNTFKIVSVVLGLFRHYPELYKKAIVSSFYPHLIYLIRREDPKIVGCLACKSGLRSFHHNNPIKLCENWYSHYLALIIDRMEMRSIREIIYYFCGISAILLHKDSITEEALSNWRRKGYRVICWTVNDTYLERRTEALLRLVLISPYVNDFLMPKPSYKFDN